MPELRVELRSHCLVIANPALRASSKATILGELFLQGALVFFDKKIFGHACRQMIPGKGFFQGTFPIGIKGGIQTNIIKCLAPQVLAKSFGPTVKTRTQLPRTHQDLSQTAITPCKYGFEKAMTG